MVASTESADSSGTNQRTVSPVTSGRRTLACRAMLTVSALKACVPGANDLAVRPVPADLGASSSGQAFLGGICGCSTPSAGVPVAGEALFGCAAAPVVAPAAPAASSEPSVFGGTVTSTVCAPSPCTATESNSG